VVSVCLLVLMYAGTAHHVPWFTIVPW